MVHNLMQQEIALYIIKYAARNLMQEPLLSNMEIPLSYTIIYISLKFDRMKYKSIERIMAEFFLYIMNLNM